MARDPADVALVDQAVAALGAVSATGPITREEYDALKAKIDGFKKASKDARGLTMVTSEPLYFLAKRVA